MKNFLLLISVLIIKFAVAKNYYVDSNSGSDSNSGTINSPWQSFIPVSNQTFSPGDSIFFKSGSVFSQTWEYSIDDSGIKNKPIVFTSYGAGAKPIFRNFSSSAWNDVFRVAANYVIIDGLKIDTTVYAGVEFQPGTNNNIVRNCEITKTGIGIAVSGSRHLVTKNYIHNLHMVVNDAFPTDNDFGALGIDIFDGIGNEISYNRTDSCFAFSYDYGEDGGSVEIYSSSSADSCYVHHNSAYNTNGYIELGGNKGKCYGMRVAYNTYVNTRGKIGFWFHLANTFGIDIQNLRFDNNTFVCYGTPEWSQGIIGWDGTLSSTNVQFTNNIFYTKDWNYICVPSSGMFGTSHNCYYKADGSNTIGFTAGAGDIIADPLLTNVLANDFHLKSGSPAIDKGLSLGYTLDFDNKPVPSGTAPDMGAFEYQLSTSIKSLENYSTAGFYPNPFSSATTIRVPENQGVTIILYNLLGEKVYEQSHIRNGGLIKREGLGNGIYLYSIYGENYNASGKLIIQ